MATRGRHGLTHSTLLRPRRKRRLMATYTENLTMYAQGCISCGVTFAMPSSLDNRRREDHQLFYCPNGHAQSYTGKTKAQKLTEQLERERRTQQWLRDERDAARDLATHERNRANGYKGALTKTKKRVGRGVCPCCNRSFPDLTAHMSTQHPTYAPEDTNA